MFRGQFWTRINHKTLYVRYFQVARQFSRTIPEIKLYTEAHLYLSRQTFKEQQSEVMSSSFVILELQAVDDSNAGLYRFVLEALKFYYVLKSRLKFYYVLNCGYNVITNTLYYEITAIQFMHELSSKWADFLTITHSLYQVYGL